MNNYFRKSINSWAPFPSRSWFFAQCANRDPIHSSVGIDLNRIAVASRLPKLLSDRLKLEEDKAEHAERKVELQRIMDDLRLVDAKRVNNFQLPFDLLFQPVEFFAPNGVNFLGFMLHQQLQRTYLDPLSRGSLIPLAVIREDGKITDSK